MCVLNCSHIAKAVALVCHGGTSGRKITCIRLDYCQVANSLLPLSQVDNSLLPLSQGTSSTDGGSSAQTRHSPQPHGDIPRLESPDAEQMHAMVMQQHNGTTQLDNSGHEIEIASGSMDTGNY
ncbi:hypothetical protein niasHT_034117 [Heterodera trifolii]|uniref:Uncharacterized protein n=1 Tax=Heterodera trifolii TaxID=157864 RepID=A0ABD2J384_9BILA